jgi:Family of unknown function (DUF5994)
MTRPFGGRGRPNPIRLSVARELGRDIDGAWWPRVDRITNELPEDACANLLIIPYSTYSTLALMLMRCAANLPIKAADRDKPAFLTADSILRAALQQCAPGCH